MTQDKDDLGGFSKIASSLGNLIDLLVDLDKRGDLPRRGRREKDGLVVEYAVRKRSALGTGADDDAEAEQPAPAQKGAPAAHHAASRAEVELVEPVTDIFEEPDAIVLMFEIPGASRSDVRCVLDGDILLLEAKAPRRLYRKEVLIEAKLAEGGPQLELNNGILEVRLNRQQ